MGGSSTVIARSDTAIGSLRLQASLMGLCRPIHFGRPRAAVNLLAYYDFTAIPHTSRTTMGGKGGGGITQSNTTYTYTAAVLMALGEGPYRDILKGWRGKLVYGAAQVDGSNNMATETLTISAATGQITVSFAGSFVANVDVRIDGNTLRPGADYTFDSFGNYAFNDPLWGKEATFRYLVTSPTARASALSQLRLELAPGWDGQAPWAYLQSKHPDQALGYSGLGYLRAAAYDLGTDAEVGNHNFELSTFTEFSETIPDAAPSVIVREFLTNGRYGANWPAERLGDLSAYHAYTVASGLFLSPAIDSQRAAADWLRYFLDLTNSDCVWSEGQLKIVPLGDAPVAANGASYAPNTTPVYDLGEEHFLADGDEAPVTPHFVAADDVYNHTRVEYWNRANGYNTDIAEAKDEADIDARGIRTQDVMEAHAICDAIVARLVAQLRLQAQLAIRGTYTFRLPWVFSLLEPLDLVTLTEDKLGYLRLPVRINSITEGDDYSFDVEAEDAPIGMASAPQYGQQQTGGYAHDFNVAPGPVTTPVFFEPPIEQTTTGLEVWCAVSGAGMHWGGAMVWTSLDGVTYRQTGRISGGARYGALTAPIGAVGPGGLAIALAGRGGAILPGSAADAAADATLCWIGDANGGEFIDHEGATLTGPHAYTLYVTRRGRFDSQAVARAAGAQFVRVDGAIGKSDPLPLSMIGQQLYFKFTSVNAYGGGVEDLADVQTYAYTITGSMANLPPSDVPSLTYAFEPFGIRWSWTPIPDQDLDEYELRVGGTSWDDAAPVTSLRGTNYLWGVQLAGDHVGRIKARDLFGNLSRHDTTMTIIVPRPRAVNLRSRFDGPDAVLDWDTVLGAYAIDRFVVRMGDTLETAAPIDTAYTQNSRIRVTWLGDRTIWVAAIDVAGNEGPSVSATMTVVAPPAPRPGNGAHPPSEVVDNFALLYWQGVAGTLPIASYLARRGVDFDSGSPLGSATGTFTAIFEQTSGTNSYWIAAVDTAGNVGAALCITATVSQPPDYVLHSTIDSLFDGTIVGLYLEDGALWGPSELKTVQAHFEDHAWPTVGHQIDAGYPRFFQPSADVASYEEIVDYGAVLPPINVTVTPTILNLFGDVTTTVQVSYKAALGDPWIDAAANATSVFASNFRYVRVRLEFAASGGDDLIALTALNIKLSVKLKSDSGTAHALAADHPTGTWVPFNDTFIDAEVPRLTPNATSPMFAVSNYLDAPYPTGFYVLLFDINGNPADGDVGWQTRGF